MSHQASCVPAQAVQAVDSIILSCTEMEEPALQAEILFLRCQALRMKLRLAFYQQRQVCPHWFFCATSFDLSQSACNLTSTSRSGRQNVPHQPKALKGRAGIDKGRRHKGPT